VTYSLRPALPADHADLAILFQASIEELAGDAYDDAQRAAWEAKAEDQAAWSKHLAGCLVLIAEEDGEPVGFAAMRDNSIIENVHVHPDMAFMGVGAQLIDAMARLAEARGAKKLTAAATDNAIPFFERTGFVAVRRSTVSAGEVWLPATVMDKALGGAVAEEGEGA
jgi:putative acetyltransferase